MVDDNFMLCRLLGLAYFSGEPNTIDVVDFAAIFELAFPELEA